MSTSVSGISFGGDDDGGDDGVDGDAELTGYVRWSNHPVGGATEWNSKQVPSSVTFTLQLKFHTVEVPRIDDPSSQYANERLKYKAVTQWEGRL